MPRPWDLSLSRRAEPRPFLTFAPLAWLKLRFFCHSGPTEVGGFGVSAADDPLYVEDFVTVRQHASPVSVRFDDDAVADLFDACVDRGLPQERFARLWLHTHPGASPEPSGTDADTFARTFGRCAWAVLFIVSRTGATYARLAFTAGPGAQLLLSTAVDWSAWPDCLADKAGELETLVAQWRQEYAAHVHRLPEPVDPFAGLPLRPPALDEPWWERLGWSPELDEVFYEPVEEVKQHAPEHRPQAP